MSPEKIILQDIFYEFKELGFEPIIDYSNNAISITISRTSKLVFALKENLSSIISFSFFNGFELETIESFYPTISAAVIKIKNLVHISQNEGMFHLPSLQEYIVALLKEIEIPYSFKDENLINIVISEQTELNLEINHFNFNIFIKDRISKTSQIYYHFDSFDAFRMKLVDLLYFSERCTSDLFDSHHNKIDGVSNE